MKFFQRNPFRVFALVLIWRVLLLIFTAQPVPGNDAFGYDGAVVNYLHGGSYCNPGFSVVFPISGRQLYATYPPLYQVALFSWMKMFGTSVISAMTLHLALFAVSGLLTLAIVKKFFPAVTDAALVALLLFGLTFDDRPEGLAYVFGLSAMRLVTQQISKPQFHAGIAAALTLALVLTLYTSVIVGAYFFGAGFLACAVALIWRRDLRWFAPFAGATALFAVITCAIAKWEPLWWAGFMESARQQSVMTNGFHAPHAGDLIKLARTAPVFIIALAAVPLVLSRRREIFLEERPWLALAIGIFAMGWILLAASVTLLAANYVSYTIFTQIILVAGLLALVEKHFPQRERLLRASVLACVILVSVRAIGMSTWGVACAWKNSYQSTRKTLQAELEPYAKSDQPILISSAFLYQAADVPVKNPVHCDWYFDHAHWTNSAQVDALIRLQPPKLVLTQFDYYRSFDGSPETPLQQLRRHPELVDIKVRNMAALTSPDAIPSMQRVVQQISWAPVIVDLDWKKPPPT